LYEVIWSEANVQAELISMKTKSSIVISWWWWLIKSLVIFEAVNFRVFFRRGSEFRGIFLGVSAHVCLTSKALGNELLTNYIKNKIHVDWEELMGNWSNINSSAIRTSYCEAQETLNRCAERKGWFVEFSHPRTELTRAMIRKYSTESRGERTNIQQHKN